MKYSRSLFTISVMLLSLSFIVAALLPLPLVNERVPQPPLVTKSTNSSCGTLIEEEQKVGHKENDLDEILTESVDQRQPPQGFRAPYDAVANMPHNVTEYKHASGNWLGYRDDLDSHGVELSITYTTDMAGNPVGGKNPNGFTYTDNLAFGCLIETKKLWGWKGGHFMISGLQRDGNSLSQKNIGNQFTVQQVFGGQTFHFYELSYQQDFWNDHASLKTGRLAAGDDFASSPLYWLYMNNGIDGNPQAIPVNGKFSCYPNAVWGSRFKADVTSSTVARLGVYQTTPQNSVHGVNWNFYPSNGVMLLGQYGWNPEFCKPTSLPDNKAVTAPSSTETSSQKIDTPIVKGLTGHYWMGGYYSSMEYSQFNSSVKTPNAYGLYWHADQTLYRPDPLKDMGLVLWSAYVLAPQQNISLMPFQVNGGAIYTGLIPGRLDDFSIFGIAYGNFSTSYASAQAQNGNGTPTYELVYELAYRISCTKFAYIQPDLQWVINPGGTGNIPNALILGAQMGVVF